MADYIAYLHKDKNSDYGVSFPDFPGCITAGSTLDEAREMAAEALSGHIEAMVKTGEQIPDPSTLDQLANDPDMRGAVAFLVSAAGPEKTVRFNVTARETQLEAIDHLAGLAGMSRSAYLVQAALRSGSTGQVKAKTPDKRRARQHHAVA